MGHYSNDCRRSSCCCYLLRARRSGTYRYCKRTEGVMKEESFKLFNEWFSYDTTSPSCVVWKKRPYRSPVKAGDHCATWTGRYYRVRLNGNYYQCSRIILILHGIFPEPGHVADHIDRNTRNNRVENLRWLSHAQNIKNTGPRGRSGFKFSSPVWNGTFQSQYRPNKDSPMVRCGTYKDAYSAHIAAVAHRLENYWNP